MAWNSSFKFISYSPLSFGILVDLEDYNLMVPFRFVNIYGTYTNKNTLWEGIKLSSLLSMPNVILRGVLDFTLSIWGVSSST
jgi:hypothetical protein